MSPSPGPKWAHPETKVVCEVAFNFENPVLVGRKVQIRPGRTASLVEVYEGETGHHIYRVGWFDFGNGRRDGYVEHTADGLEHFWRPYEVKTPVAPREPRPMVVGAHPDKPNVRGKRHIGYWASDKDPMRDSYEAKRVLLPWPEDFVDPEWRGHEKNMVIAHLRNAPDVEGYFGFASCRICGIKCGATDKSDGTYVWPSGLAHYLEEHGLRPPPEFLMHIIKQNASRRTP